MGCFVFSDGAKNGESKSLSNMSSNSEFGGNEVNRSGSDLSSKETSDTSRESMGKNLFYSMSQRSSNLRVFTFQELKNASKGFSRSSKIGEGGFGCVYKGVLNCFEDPSTDVAIKQLGKRGLQGHKQWVTEVNVLGVVEHRNLVKLLGYCADDDERGIQRLLVYEYMPNGSVDDHLSSQAKAILPWSLRLRIARDAACGLTYLHEEMDFQIIFRDFKSSNILLDEKWNAKLSDFGLARLGPAEGFTHVSTAVVGTMGYAAPEYLRTGRLTCKNDLWSYGVFLYELITGRKSVDKNQPKKDQRLLDWIKPYLADPRKFEQIVDPRLGRDYPLKSIRKIAAIANRCLVRHPKSRPKMSEVLDMVNKILGESAELPMLPLPLPNSEADEASMENHGKGRTQGSKSRENDWVGRWWRRKFMKTLTLGTCKSLNASRTLRTAKYAITTVTQIVERNKARQKLAIAIMASVTSPLRQ